MPTNIVVPELGESVVEATVARWLKKEGDAVSVGEPVVELETEKIDLEVGASHAGVLARIAQPEGTDVKIGEVLGVIEDAGAGAGNEAAAHANPVQKAGSEQSTSPPVAPSPSPASGSATEQPASAALPGTDKPRITASAKKLAGEHAVDLSTLTGTGESGRVTRQDVEDHLKSQSAHSDEAAPAPPSAPPPFTSAAPVPSASAPVATAAPTKPGDRAEERVRMSRRRMTIARRLVEAQRTAAMLTTFNEIDMTAVQDLRRRRKESFRARYGVSLGLSSFFIKASVAALKAYPRLNAEIQGDEMVLKKYYDIGVAVGATEGLVVPVLRDADRMTFAGIEAGIKDFVHRAEDGSLTLEDLRGGTFTITNGGVFGSLLSTPILNPPQVGILGLHKIEDRAVPLNGQVVIRPMMYVALSYDHRLVDGLEAVQFLVRIKELVEDPAGLLLEA